MKSRPRRWPGRWHLSWVVLLGLLTFPVEASTPPLAVHGAPTTAVGMSPRKICPNGYGTPDGGLTCAGGMGGCLSY